MSTRYAAFVGAFFLALVGAAPSASAATCTWNGSTGAWTTASAWSCNAVPGATDDVVIPSGTVAMDTGTRLAIRALTITGGTLTGADSLTVSGAFVWEAGTMDGSGATLVQGAAALRAATAKNVGREIILVGNTDWSSGTLQMHDGGLLRNRGFFNDTATGTHSIARVGTITTEPLVHNQGRWQIVSAGTNTNVDFLNDGTLLLGTNGFKINAPARFTHAPAARIAGGSFLDFTSGAIVAMGGYVQPGGEGAIGFFEVRGPYPMGPQHVLDVEIGTGVPTADLLQTRDGTVLIDGVLWLRVPGASVLGNTYTIITHGGSGGLSGCYAPEDVRVFGPDSSPLPYDVQITCTGTTVTVTFLTSTAGEGDLAPEAGSLGVTGANPFTGRTTLALTVPASGTVSVEAFDALGRRVAVLLDGAVIAGTPVPVTFDAAALPAGLYVVRATGAGVAVARTLTLTR